MHNYEGLKFKFFAPTVVKTLDGDNGDRVIRGYAATTDLDRQGDVIAPNALAKAAEDLKKNSTVFYEHKHDQFPVGRVLDAGVDDKGLWVEVLISKTANEIWTLIQEGILNKFSIGGRVVTAQRAIDKNSGKPYNLITNMELYEVSVVGLPANPKADFKQVKSIAECISKAYERKERISDALESIAKGGKEMTEPVKKEEVPTPIEKKEEVKVEEKKEETTVEKTEEKKEETLKEEVKSTPEVVEKKEETVVEKKEEPKVEDKKEEPKPEEKKEEKVEETLEKKEEPAKKELTPAPAVEVPEEVPEEEEEEWVDVGADIKAIKDTLTEIVGAVKGLTDLVNNMMAANKDLQKSLETKEAVVTEVEKVDYEKVTEIITKALNEKLGKIRLVPSRKGTIVKTDIVLKDEEDSEDIDTLLDGTKFDALPKEKQREILKSTFARIIKG